MFMEERQKEILRRVNETGRISVSEIQSQYQVSADCARRDLRLLESRGLLQRTHGGAIAAFPKGIFPPKGYTPDPSMEEKPGYLAVAQKALTHIQPHNVVYLTTSSVGYLMALHWPENLEATVLVNSLAIADVLRKKECVSLVFLGGGMSHRGNCHDFYTLQMVRNLRIDQAFLSHTGFSLEFGASLHDSAGMEFARAVMENSSLNIGLYPSDKLGRNSLHLVCRAMEYDLLITDQQAPEDFLLQAQELGLSWEVAGK